MCIGRNVFIVSHAAVAWVWLSRFLELQPPQTGDGKTASSSRRLTGRPGAPDVRLLRQLGTNTLALRGFSLRIQPR